MIREKILNANGYTVERIWGCEWNEIKSTLENKKKK